MVEMDHPVPAPFMEVTSRNAKPPAELFREFMMMVDRFNFQSVKTLLCRFHWTEHSKTYSQYDSKSTYIGSLILNYLSKDPPRPNVRVAKIDALFV